jgi:hypothetical protein
MSDEANGIQVDAHIDINYILYILVTIVSFTLWHLTRIRQGKNHEPALSIA